MTGRFKCQSRIIFKKLHQENHDRKENLLNDKTQKRKKNVTAKRTQKNILSNRPLRKNKQGATKIQKRNVRAHQLPISRKNANRGHNNEKLKVIPIGGLGEIGKNMTAFEYHNQIIIVDCGLKFPDDDMYGIDMVLPPFKYFTKNAKKIKGLVITHGHEDHIGGIAYLLKEINVPIYATKFTMGLIDRKLTEHRLIGKAKRHIVKAGDDISIGDFNVEFIRVNHSIADAVALCIKTPAATVFHTGDFKIDFQPIDGEIIDLQRIAALGNQGVDLLLADSTNVEEAGFTQSESTVGQTFFSLFRGCKNRIIVTTFASNVHRVQQIIDAAVAYNRKVIINGRSMETMVEVATNLGYLKVPKNTIIDIHEMKNYRPKDIVVITTGSQGEPMAALGRMANGDHRFLQIDRNDTIIISASPVPGNEKMVAEIINKLVGLGSEVVYNKFAHIHVSGHARREELKMIQTLVKPKNFMPVHGETRMLKHHGALAQDLGLDPKHVFIQKNGDVLALDHNGCAKIDHFDCEPVLVDGLGVGDIDNIVLYDRKRLSEDGLFMVVITMHNKKVVASPDIITRGFLYSREGDELIEHSREIVSKAMIKFEKEGLTDWKVIRRKLVDLLSRYLYRETRRRPMIINYLVEV